MKDVYEASPGSYPDGIIYTADETENATIIDMVAAPRRGYQDEIIHGLGLRHHRVSHSTRTRIVFLPVSNHAYPERRHL